MEAKARTWKVLGSLFDTSTSGTYHDLAMSGRKSPPSKSESLVNAQTQMRSLWKREVLEKVLSYHEEKNDVHMCLSIVYSCGLSKSKEAALQTEEGDPTSRFFSKDKAVTTSDNFFMDLVPREKLVAWHFSYIELLARLSLHMAKARVIRNAPLAEVNQLSQSNSTFNAKCPVCSHAYLPIRGTDPDGTKPTPVDAKSTAVCKCGRKTRQCSICGGVVRGLWTGCQICLHGGHASCMRDWARRHPNQTQCPMCNHHCFVPMRSPICAV